MRGVRAVFLVLASAAFGLALCEASMAGFLQQQRAQTSLYVQVNVTPAPLVMAPEQRAPFDFAAQRGKGSAAGFDAARLHGVVIAATQGSVPVQANVQASATGPLLTLSTTALNISQQAGTTQTYPCPFTVAITTSVTSWTLQSGVTADFAGSFPGNDLAYNLYVGSPPSPETFTAFVVYPKNNNAWANAATSGGNKTYCVDLQVTIPAAVPGGTYSTNAVYTLLY